MRLQEWERKDDGITIQGATKPKHKGNMDCKDFCRPASRLWTKLLYLCFLYSYVWELADLVHNNVSLKKESLSVSRLKKNFSKGNPVSRIPPQVQVSLLSTGLYQLTNGFWTNLRSQRESLMLQSTGHSHAAVGVQGHHAKGKNI